MVQQFTKFSSGLEIELKSYSSIEQEELLLEIEDKGYKLSAGEWEVLLGFFLGNEDYA
jgi:hypothetical protein